MKKMKKIFAVASIVTLLFASSSFTMMAGATNQEKELCIPSCDGHLISQSYIDTFGKKSGSTMQWNYNNSASFSSGSGSLRKLTMIWKAGASLRNSASISLGLSETGAKVGGSASWADASTTKSYVSSSSHISWNSNIVAAPERDYRTNTVYLITTARAELYGDNKPYEISSGV